MSTTAADKPGSNPPPPPRAPVSPASSEPIASSVSRQPSGRSSRRHSGELRRSSSQQYSNGTPYQQQPSPSVIVQAAYLPAYGAVMQQQAQLHPRPPPRYLPHHVPVVVAPMVYGPPIAPLAVPSILQPPPPPVNVNGPVQAPLAAVPTGIRGTAANTPRTSSSGRPFMVQPPPPPPQPPATPTVPAAQRAVSQAVLATGSSSASLSGQTVPPPPPPRVASSTALAPAVLQVIPPAAAVVPPPAPPPRPAVDVVQRMALPPPPPPAPPARQRDACLPLSAACPAASGVRHIAVVQAPAAAAPPPPTHPTAAVNSSDPHTPVAAGHTLAFQHIRSESNCYSGPLTPWMLWYQAGLRRAVHQLVADGQARCHLLGLINRYGYGEWLLQQLSQQVRDLKSNILRAVTQGSNAGSNEAVDCILELEDLISKAEAEGPPGAPPQLPGRPGYARDSSGSRVRQQQQQQQDFVGNYNATRHSHGGLRQQAAARYSQSHSGYSTAGSNGYTAPANGHLHHGQQASAAGPRTVIDDAAESRQQLACIICLDAPRSVLLLPCKHLVLCSKCADELKQKAVTSREWRSVVRSQPVCPVCREVVTSNIQDVYL